MKIFAKCSLGFFLASLVLSCWSISAKAQQLKVGDNNRTIDTNAIFEFNSRNKGLLIPRLPLASSTSTYPLSAHVAGMVVYNDSATSVMPSGIYYDDGSKWQRALSTGSAVVNNIVTVTSSYTLTDTDYTVIFTGTSAPTFTLPDPTTCKGRQYRIINGSHPSVLGLLGISITLSRSVYLDTGDTTTSIVSYGVAPGLLSLPYTVMIQSDGSKWWCIGQ